MPPIDCSKWDNIDADSEPEETSPLPTLTPNVNPSPTPGTSDSTVCPSESVQAVIVRCEVERLQAPPYSATTIPADHVVFSNPVPHVPQLIEVPLVFHRPGTWSDYRPDLDNQIITYININATSGFAPPEWASGVGTVIVARQDKKPLLPHHLEGVWMYCDYILDLFGEGEGAPRQLYNRKAFEKWWKRYCEEQKHVRQGTRGEEDPDDWRTVRSPYGV
ncbi:hypothetical protein E0Z10_g5937 [Xylaria hypoxylon]|uniref:Uncharacterized protein n=1 Tax=Xylaria hypoxylon TaxID=37992 RepID=A0A4Z0YUN1_9PEZI|nr:hypothetical protein E0Z10_g5937 [Xylaria hypoxylon]